jgi:hypothetical protein
MSIPDKIYRRQMLLRISKEKSLLGKLAKGSRATRCDPLFYSKGRRQWKVN